MKQLFNLLLITFILFINYTVQAQATRTWVSGVGDDANPCSRTAPCKTLAGAFSKTAAGGEISILDPCSMGPATINKSVTINAEGILGGIITLATSGIIVSAGATDVVTIRNVSIINATSGSTGINFVSGGTLNVEKCTIQNYATGILLNGTTKYYLSVKNSNITNCSSAAIDVTTSTDTANVAIDNCLFQRNGSGFNASTGAIVSVSNTSISQNVTGVRALNNAEVNLSECTISNNYSGVISNDLTSTVRLTGNRILSNASGISGNGKVISFGNNKIAGNGINSSVNILVLPTQ